MSSTITRLYRSHGQATEAVEELKRRGFSDGSIRMIGPEERGGADDRALQALTNAGVSEPEAKAFVPGLRDGGTVLVVHAFFGMATRAIAALDGYDPIKVEDTGYHYDVSYRPDADPAAPLSAAMGWRVLSSNPTPLSSWLGLKVLSNRQQPNIKLSSDPAPLSQKLGMRTLLDDPEPLSRRAKWRSLWGDAAPLSSRVNMPVLTQSQAPKVKLLHDAAPMSTGIGIPLLSNNPAPLSSLLGWSPLSHQRRETADPTVNEPAPLRTHDPVPKEPTPLRTHGASPEEPVSPRTHDAAPEAPSEATSVPAHDAAPPPSPPQGGAEHPPGP